MWSSLRWGNGSGGGEGGGGGVGEGGGGGERPLSGEVVAVNPAVEGSPDLVNKDPYGQGWLLILRVADPAEVAGLLDAAAYEAFLKGAG